MTKWKYKISTLLLITFISFNYVLGSNASMSHIQKEISKSFDINQDALVGIQNKYGDVNISTWSENRIVVDVLIKVKTKNKSKGQTFLDGINVEFTHTPSKVGMKTVYPDKENSSWWDSWWNNSNNIVYEVYYDIKAPKGISTTLINKYGNIKQSDIDGFCDATNKYGNIYLGKVGGNLSIDLGYGKTTVDQAKNVNIDIKNSTLKIKDCNTVRMTSKYSELTFGTCGDMQLDSKYDVFKIDYAKSIRNDGKYDDLKIGEVERFIVDTKNSSIKIKKITKKCIVDSKYGTISVKSTGSDMEKISIESKYTMLNFGIDTDFRLKFLAEYTDFKIDVPHNTTKSITDGKEKDILAYRGSKNAKLDIKVIMKYGGFSIHDNL